MTPSRFNECLEMLHWAKETLAGILKCDKSLIVAYSLGSEEIPPNLGAWLETLAQVHEMAEIGMPTQLKGKRHAGLLQ